MNIGSINNVSFNGKRIKIDGTLSMVDGKWYLNGNEVNLADLAESNETGKAINITINIEGSISHLNIDHCDTITINGDCKRVSTNCGSINCGNVDGDVRTNYGNVDCGNVEGDVKANFGSVYRK